MNYYHYGLKDKDLIKIFNELKLILEFTSNYCKSYPPYTFTEASTTGYIISACGRLNYAAIQEYRTKWKIKDKINYGRGDLIVFVNANKVFRFEAKQLMGFQLNFKNTYKHLRQKRNKNLVQIEGYKGMMVKNCDAEKYISLMYIVPFIKEGIYFDNSQLNSDWEKYINTVKEEYCESSNFILSYSNDLNTLKFKYDKGVKAAWPGIIILGDIIQCPK